MGQRARQGRPESRGWRGALVGLSVAIAPAAAHAQDAVDPAQEIAPVEVAPADGTGASGSEVMLDAITVRSVRAGPEDGTPTSTSVLDRGTVMTETQPDRVSDFLELVPGVTTSESPGDPATAINIRGLQDFGRVNVTIDGARQNFQTSGHGANGVFYFDPEMLGQVQVTRGATATAEGASQIGGVVAFDTLTADDVLDADRIAGARARMRYGSNGDEVMGHTEFATRIGDAFDLVAAGTAKRDDDYRDGNGDVVPESWDEMLSGLLKARWRPTDEQQITASALLYRARYDAGGGLSGNTVRRTSAKSDTYSLRYRYTPADTPWVDLGVNAYFNDSATHQTDETGSNIGSKRSFDLDTTGLDAANTSRFETGPFAHALSYGVNAFHDAMKSTDEAGSANLYTPSGQRTVYGGFIEDRIGLGWFELIPALRYDRFELSGNGTSNSGGAPSPKVTLAVTPVEQLTLFTSYAEAWRAPTITETLMAGFPPPPAVFEFLPNPNLKPETAHEVQFGANVRFNDVAMDGDQFRMKIVGYHNVVDDYIAQVRVIDTSSGPPIVAEQYQNLDRVHLWGGEIEATYDAGFAFVSVAGQIVDGFEDDRKNGLHKKLYSIPADRVVTTLGVRALEDRLLAGVRIAAYGAVEDVPSGSTPAGGYTLFDIFAAYAVNDRLTANLQVENLFNRQYQQYLDLATTPGAGINAKLSVSVKL